MNKTLAISCGVLVVVLAAIGYVAWRYKTSISAGSNGQASVGQTISPEGADGQTATISSVAGAAGATSTTSDPHAAASATSDSVTAAAIVPQVGWQAYREDEYAVAGTFPDSWYEYDAVPFGGSLEFTSVLEADALTGGDINQGSAEITIYRAAETLAEARSEDLLTGMQESMAMVTVAGENVPVVAYDIGSIEDTLVAYVPYDGYVYRVVLSYHGEPAFGSAFANFLATFQFEN